MKRFVSLILIICTSNLIFAAFPIFEVKPDPNEGVYKTVGYLMGMFMLIFGVIIAYAYNNKIMLKAAWKGFFTVIGIFILYVALMFILYSYTPGFSFEI